MIKYVFKTELGSTIEQTFEINDKSSINSFVSRMREAGYTLVNFEQSSVEKVSYDH